jgi:cysteine desulfurase/selenocysteine lyase
MAGTVGNAIMKKLLPDFNALRQDFPILEQKIHGKPLVYLDSTASSQKPQQVIAALLRYYSTDHANVHRGVHTLSVRATQAYEKTREQIRVELNAKSTQEIIFVRGATEGINLVAQSYGRHFLKKDDEIILSVMEHHSNIVPWQWLCKAVGAVLRVIPMSDVGELDLSAYQQLFNSRTKMVAVTQVSNVLGTINPVKAMIAVAHQYQVPVLIDGACAFGHLPIDVQELDCDFYVLSSHKAYGPTGMGVLYGKKALLESMPPYQGGGDMIETVSFEQVTYSKLPYKFEAGTPAIAAVVGFGAALAYVKAIGMEHIVAHEKYLLNYATEKLRRIPGLRLLGESQMKIGIISFVLAGVHAHDLGTFLDHEGIAIRVGHHCAMPLMDRLQVPATARLSFGLYNTTAEIDVLVAGLLAAKRFFS